MSEEAERALEGWRPGMQVDLYDWTRHVTMRVAMRALFGLDPDRAGVDVAATFERGLSFYEREYLLQVLRGPGSPFLRLVPTLPNRVPVEGIYDRSGSTHRADRSTTGDQPFTDLIGSRYGLHREHSGAPPGRLEGRELLPNFLRPLDGLPICG